MKRKALVVLLAVMGLMIPLGAASASTKVDCLFLQDGTMTWEELVIVCQEFIDGYNWDEPPYEIDYPHDCSIYSVGQSWEDLVEDCLAGYEAEGFGSYAVQDGDLSLWSISQRYGISFGALLDANAGQLENVNLIRVGDEIRLP